MSFRGAAAVVCCLLILCGVPGCGGSSNGRVEIQGTVKLDGKPVENGAIAFIPAEGVKGPSAGAVIQAGKYQVPAQQGPAVGKHRVEITATRTAGTSTVKGVAGGTGGPSAGGSVASIEMYIPEQYNKKSNLEYVVKTGSNEQNFDLKSNE